MADTKKDTGRANMRQKLSIASAIATLVLIGCQNPGATSDTFVSSDVPVEDISPTSVRSETASTIIQAETNTPIATLETPQSTPVVVSTPTLGATPTLYLFAEKDFYLNDLIFDSVDPTCQLPCWRKVRPGESTYQETRDALIEVFQVDLNSLRSYEISSVPGSTSGRIPLYYTKGMAWSVSKPDFPLPSMAEFHIDSVFTDDTDQLQALAFSWLTTNSDMSRIDISPVRAIRELGIPDQMFAQAESYGRLDFGGIHILLLYNTGVVVEFFYDSFNFDVGIEANGETDKVTGDLCLGENETTSNFGIYIGNIYLMRSFSSDLENLDPYQEAYIPGRIEWSGYQPIEFITGSTAKEISERAQAGNDVCLTFDVDKHP